MANYRRFALLLASSVLFTPPGLVLADPVVIPGVGPKLPEAADAASYNVPPPAAATPAPRLVAAATNSGNFGGGFVELLLTGRNPSPLPRRDPNAPVYAPAPPAAMSAHYEPETQPRRSIDPIYLRQEVDFNGHEKPGTIVIDTPHKFLFLVLPGGRALRYGIGVGRPGFEWSGIKSISRKAEWPDWTPPPEMLQRRPDLPTHMDGGPANPLGARALYLGSSLYRIHGTNEPYTIGTNVSSGCIRMMNEDVIDLYGRVQVGTKVVVM
jgi:lipoprotein-anchoring transpeptidase ErfK/SrfK